MDAVTFDQSDSPSLSDTGNRAVALGDAEQQPEESSSVPITENNLAILQEQYGSPDAVLLDDWHPPSLEEYADPQGFHYADDAVASLLSEERPWPTDSLNSHSSPSLAISSLGSAEASTQPPLPSPIEPSAAETVPEACTVPVSDMPCKFFRAGQCAAGEDCPFSHVLDANPTRKRVQKVSRGAVPPAAEPPDPSCFPPLMRTFSRPTSVGSVASSVASIRSGVMSYVRSFVQSPHAGQKSAPDLLGPDEPSIDESGRTRDVTREEKRRRRRESHNMVERRRRDKINELIQELSRLVPYHRLMDRHRLGSIDVAIEDAKGPNKGDILQGAVSWMRDLMWILNVKCEQQKHLEGLIEGLGGTYPFPLVHEEKMMLSEFRHLVHKNSIGNSRYSRSPPSGLFTPEFLDEEMKHLEDKEMHQEVFGPESPRDPALFKEEPNDDNGAASTLLDHSKAQVKDQQQEFARAPPPQQQQRTDEAIRTSFDQALMKIEGPPTSEARNPSQQSSSPEIDLPRKDEPLASSSKPVEVPRPRDGEAGHPENRPICMVLMANDALQNQRWRHGSWFMLAGVFTLAGVMLTWEIQNFTLLEREFRINISLLPDSGFKSFMRRIGNMWRLSCALYDRFFEQPIPVAQTRIRWRCVSTLCSIQ